MASGNHPQQAAHISGRWAGSVTQMTDLNCDSTRDDVDELIERRFNDLSRRLQQAARYIVDNPLEVALSSMRAVATRAHVDPSSMVRLAQELGFAGYDDLRDRYRRKLLVDEGAWSGRARHLQTRKNLSSGIGLLEEILKQDQINLGTTFSAETNAALEQSTRLVADARSVFVVGLRSLYPIAFYFHYTCRLFNAKTVLLTGTGGTFADDLRLAQREDVMLVFSYRPYSRDAVYAVDFMKNQGAKVIAVTDSRVSPIASKADVAIAVSSKSASLLPSILPFLAIAQSLATLMVSNGGDDAIRKISRSEQQLQSFRVYHDDQQLRRQKPT
jgi:DNA-binding MurR/RpiR family transcriptional regulator